MKNKKPNPTLTKNMPNVKWTQLPPRKGPDYNGIQTSYKQVVTSKKVSKKSVIRNKIRRKLHENFFLG